MYYHGLSDNVLFRICPGAATVKPGSRLLASSCACYVGVNLARGGRGGGGASRRPPMHMQLLHQQGVLPPHRGRQGTPGSQGRVTLPSSATEWSQLPLAWKLSRVSLHRQRGRSPRQVQASLGGSECMPQLPQHESVALRHLGSTHRHR